MSPVSTSFGLSRSLISAALGVIALATVPCSQAAQTVETPFAIGLAHAKATPYNFTGRVLTLDLSAFGSGTLLRRHTVQTAGHVVFDPVLGLTTNATFTRGLYEDFQVSQSQVIAAASLSGYQAVVDTSGSNDTLAAFSEDMGYLLLHDAPVDENWANFITQPSLLTSVPTFVLGYPGVTFDGVTLAYVVPPLPYVGVGNSISTSLFENPSYTVEEGMSGGPIYVVPDGVNQIVAAETVAVFTGSSASGTAVVSGSYVRAIDKTAQKFLTDAEYTAGLITQVNVTGPKVVTHGHTYTYTATVIFAVASATTGGTASTDRYPELKLKSSSPATAVTVKKTSNTTFDVTYASSIRAGSTTTLQIFYDKQATPQGKSSRLVKIQ